MKCMKFKIDFHVHSYKSFDSVLTYDEIVKTAKQRGLDGVCICDHACIDISQSLAANYPDFIIIPAVEFTTGKNHIISMFLNSIPKVDFSRGFALQPQKIVKATKECGGICILAHPFERLKEGKATVSEQAKNIMKLVDGIEVYNSRAPYKYQDANKLAQQTADELNSVCRTAGSDAHLEGEIGGAYCIVDAQSLSLDDIKNAVLSGKVEIVGKHCKRTFITKSEFIKSKKLKYPLKRRLKFFISYPIRSLIDLYDVIFKREL